MTAARRGTAEIGLAVMATTFTILAVFLPVGFMTGIVGQFFKSFALTIAFAVAMSLLVAFTLTPTLAARWIKVPEGDHKYDVSRRGFYGRIDRRRLGHQHRDLDDHRICLVEAARALVTADGKLKAE